MARLLGDAGKQRALLLRLDHADGLAIHEQEVIARAGFQRRFAQRDATAGRGIELPVILNDPAGRGELRVDLLASALFGRFSHGSASDLIWIGFWAGHVRSADVAKVSKLAARESAFLREATWFTPRMTGMTHIEKRVSGQA